jgi:hypothetical protein
MNPNILFFRNSCAEDGIELTPKEANKFYKAYVALKKEIEDAVAQCPTFYMELCNRTTEQKLEDIKRINRERGDSMTLKDYNELQATVKTICELEGYGH